MKSKPNVLWIVSDHQVHATRPAGFDRFPLQKELARLGVSFNFAYSVLPVCSPARASMLTGLYPHAHGLTENDGRFGGRPGLDRGDWMIQRALLDAGYRCAWFGKWHVDNRYSAVDYGFEGFSLPGYGYPYATKTYRDYLQRTGLEKPVARIEIAGESGTAPGTSIDLTQQADWFDYESGSAVLEGPVEAHESFFVTDLAQRWIEGSKNQPWFVRVDTWGPHPPYLVADPFHGMLDGDSFDLPASFSCDLSQRPQHHRDYRDEWQQKLKLDEKGWRRMYQRALEHGILVESALCRLLQTVNLENTLVIFNSDHGDAIGSSGGVANKGGLMAEATMRIPLFMAGTGLPVTAIEDTPVSNLDLVPTVFDLCGIDCDREFHGESLVPLIESLQSKWRAGFMAQHYGLHQPVTQRAWYRQDWKLVLQQDGFEELYRLSDDPDELENLALRETHREQLETMKRELHLTMQSVGDCDLTRHRAT